ncbi:unnamed protein product [Prorocentrum cordatum]|uniref:Uncharacterized protein n=1 Tax=Prorocentrum cordatum TaxID=2364126 RepID=A0ABN9TCI3_9DINO|nr:unnamed protein product [Polarella glacialis]
MAMLAAAVAAALALPGAAMGPGGQHLSLLDLDRGRVHVDLADIGVVVKDEEGGDIDFRGETSASKKPKRSNTSYRKAPSRRASVAVMDEVIPVLEQDFKSTTQQLKLALASFKDKQRAMDVAKRETTVAMKLLRQEAEKRRRSATDRRMAKQKELQTFNEAKRTAKEAMVKKAQALMASKGTDANGMMSSLSLGIMVDVLMALPTAVENPIFSKRLVRSKEQAVASVQDFLNITRRKTSKFVLASSKASDVELSFLMARYFHEASFRVKAMQSDAEKIARDLNVVMPRELRQSFLPIVRSLRANAVPLRVNASDLAKATLPEACSQISSLMANISGYNNKLDSMHTGLHNLWQLSELMLPHMSKVYPMKTSVIDTVKDFMSMATTQVAGLQESADEIVTNVGPIVIERMQCTWSAAHARSGLGLVAAALASTLFA